MSKTVISEVQQIPMWHILPCMHRLCLILLKISSHFFQAEQEVLARMEVDVQAARLLTWKVAFLPVFKSSLED